MRQKDEDCAKQVKTADRPGKPGPTVGQKQEVPERKKETPKPEKPSLEPKKKKYRGKKRGPPPSSPN